MYFIFEDDDIPYLCFSTPAEPAPADESNLHFSSTIELLSPKSTSSMTLLPIILSSDSCSARVYWQTESKECSKGFTLMEENLQLLLNFSTLLKKNHGIDCFLYKSIEIVGEKTQFIFPFTSAL